LHVYLAARHVTLSDALRAYVEKHLIEPIRNHTGLKIIRTEVQLFTEGVFGGCHVLVEIKGHHEINVRELQQDMHAAIDLAKDRVVHQLTQTHAKILTQRRHPMKFHFARLGRALGWIRSNRTHEV
jgi:ribosomal subunit interface protein